MSIHGPPGQGIQRTRYEETLRERLQMVSLSSTSETVNAALSER